uniref:Juvenile hormone acid O-methyltransferase isoform A n=1 Tax=Blattella germanica TaxID=6973 RepID=A0A2C8C2A6_BLAGE|nr:Juvenile hormone acid O-methyltransferase isoform A [Blattella germanica]SIW59358.1 Juvenile hormone acid O-methyltransferase isoform B [Blattella germanica]SIW59359.1 Juvenile hormone acid O-methyltransferase isoform C [Blattella germanica]
MNNPHLYNSAHGLQQKDVEQVLSDYLDKMNWKPGSRIMDIGCGPGYITSKMLMPRLPQDFETLLAVDLSHDMIQYAKNTYIHPKLNFMQLDIETENINNDLCSPGFDKIFSFFCLHFVVDQRRAFNNISRLLRPGGEVLVLLVTTCSLFDVYSLQSKKSKWSQYLKDVQKYTSPFHTLSDAKEEFKRITKDANLSLLKCELKPNRHNYPSFAILQDSLQAINPFISNVPDELHDEFMKDVISEAEKIEKEGKNNNGKYSFSYEILVAHLRKS